MPSPTPHSAAIADARRDEKLQPAIHTISPMRSLSRSATAAGSGSIMRISAWRKSRQSGASGTWSEHALSGAARRFGRGPRAESQSGPPRAYHSMDYFTGLDISMEETHICVLDRDGAVVYEANRRRRPTRLQKSWRKRRAVVRSYSRLDAWRRPVPRAKPTRGSRSLRREPASLPRAKVARDPQVRSQRRARAGASGSNRLLQARSASG